MRRLSALFLMVLLVAALLPAAEGEGCRLCGKVGRCCCFLPLAAAPGAHCAMRGSGSACRLARTDGRPAALRASHFPDRTTGAFQTLFVTGLPGRAGLVAAAGQRRSALFRPHPPTPPPRRLV